MVNLLLVSHSKKLVEGLAEMVQQMVSSKNVKIATAAGVGENHQELGTNAMDILEKIEEIYSEDGILILMDLGSALLSTEMALDLLHPEMRANIKVCPAPFVEGSVSAGVQADLGADLETVYREAMQSLRAKNDQLAEEELEPAVKESPCEAVPASEGDLRSVTLIVPNEQGLHARPAVLFVKTVNNYDATVRIKNLTKNKGPEGADSLISVMLIAANKGDLVEINAEGPQKDEVIAALEDLFDRNFDE